MINNIEDLTNAVQQQKDQFQVSGKAFEFCDAIHQSQISASGNDWSIACSSGWMGIFTALNHYIHRRFMKQEKRDLEDLQHNISKNYIIRKTSQKGQYEMILRK
ncbi:hypothetical protein COSHB9_14910 [Companilactobacillus alimentarius]|uniref:hypothetical protein n=1 Tax=Companilactobacillus alimentarius TaxID=1602 RepID=UPI0028B92204|nr:hypothetical protein [Companilactobacillus alimentarius]MDT6952186.1 hypothetical protein [Companilactobacillus alimentarius]